MAFLRKITFLLRRPFIFIIIAIVCFVIIIQLASSGAPPSRPPVGITPSLTNTSITENQYTTLIVILENQASQVYSVEYHIAGIFSVDELRFYFTNGTPLPDPVWNGKNYSIVYPITTNLDVGSQWGVSVLVKGLDPKGLFAKYTIYTEVWADNVLSDRKSIQLQVNATASTTLGTTQ